MNLKNLLGFWSGTTAEDSFLHYTEIEIISTPKSDSSNDNNEEFSLCLISKQFEIYPVVPLTWTSSTSFTTSIPNDLLSTGTSVKGHYDATRHALTLQFHGSLFDVDNFTVTLHQHDASLERFRRATTNLDYNYKVPSSDHDASFFPPANASSHGLDTQDLTAMVNKLLRLDSGDPNAPRVDGVLVLKDSHLVLEEYFFGLSPSDHHAISSCTKSVTSLLVGIAWDHGLIDLDEPVCDIFPEITDTTWNQDPPIRVRHVLSMTTGSFDDGGANGMEERLLLSDHMGSIVLSAKREVAPGKRFEYNNQLPFLAGLILERKIARNMADFAKEVLFEPLGIREPEWAFLPNQKSVDGGRFAFAAGAMMLTLRDLARLGQLVLKKGVWDGRQVVSEKWIELSTGQSTIKGDYPYGFYWHLSTEDQLHFHKFGAIMAIGQGEQICAVLPELDMVVAWMSSTWVRTLPYRAGLKIIDEEFISKITT